MIFIAGLVVLIWIVLGFFWHGFWRADQKLPTTSTAPDHWPHIIAVVPARNEEETIERCLRGLVEQNYPGEFSVVLSNDSSTDDTAKLARALSAPMPRCFRLPALQ